MVEDVEAVAKGAWNGSRKVGGRNADAKSFAWRLRNDLERVRMIIFMNSVVGALASNVIEEELCDYFFHPLNYLSACK